MNSQLTDSHYESSTHKIIGFGENFNFRRCHMAVDFLFRILSIEAELNFTILLESYKNVQNWFFEVQFKGPFFPGLEANRNLLQSV